jgi:CheY-like chemotaxis protein
MSYGPHVPRKPLETTAVVGALHDVANALTLVLAWASEARAVDATEEARAHALGMIEERARVARDLARRAIGVPPAEVESDRTLDSVVAGVFAALNVEGKRRGVALRVGRAAGTARVASAADVAQILTNLLLNALAFAPRGSGVVVDAEARGTSVTVDVQDEGPGVDDARAAAVFEGESTRTGGAGVGLQHSRAVARTEGGDLMLVASPSGVGARFRLTWPRVGASIPPPPMSMPRGTKLTGTKVLVLEDDAEVALLLETALTARGAEVMVARNAAELAVAAREHHDAALVDLSPIMDDVRGAVSSIRGGSPGIALVVISGSAVGVPDELLALDAGSTPASPAFRWVRKPFEVAEIVAALEEARARTE